MALDKKIQQYIDLKKQIDELEEKLDLIKDDVLTITKESDDKIEGDNFVIKRVTREKFAFSDEYEAKSKELKELRKHEIKEKIATPDGVTEYVTLKFID